MTVLAVHYCATVSYQNKIYEAIVELFRMDFQV